MTNAAAISNMKYVVQQHRGDPDFMLSLARGLLVLLAFTDRNSPLSGAEIARSTGLDRAVVRRCIHTLKCLSMVRRDEGKFLLDTNVLNLGHAYFSSIDMMQHAQPILDHLSDVVHTNCALAMFNSGDVVYLARSQNRRLMLRSLGMGSRLPAHCTSLGRVLLAQMGASELDQYFTQIYRPKITQHTVTNDKLLRGILAKVRRDGFAVVSQEVELDLVGIAVPVKINGFAAPLALSVTTNVRYTAPHEMALRYLNPMQEAAMRLGTI